MKMFRIAVSGDYLDEAGEQAYGDLGWSAWDAVPYIRYRFLAEQSPGCDPSYWQHFYSLQMMPEQVHDIEGLVVLRPWVKTSLFRDGAGKLVVIGRAGAGYDKVDLDACTAHDIAVFNAPRALDHPTASSALMFLLVLAKKLPQQERVARQGRWDLQAHVLGGELRGRTLGIIGLGNSGRELARLVGPFGMRILAYSPHANAPAAEQLGVRLTSLDEVLREADFLSMHCRLTPQTRHLLGPAELAKMKPSAYLVNVARGELIDEAALVEALRSGRLAGSALDVFEREPLPADDPLLKLDNVVVTPHWSASTTDVWRGVAQIMITGMLRAASGRVPDHVVNPAVLTRPGFHQKLAAFAENTGIAARSLDSIEPAT
jgi:phosphoglycerate dehydrogenase-like enzyme